MKNHIIVYTIAITILIFSCSNNEFGDLSKYREEMNDILDEFIEQKEDTNKKMLAGFNSLNDLSKIKKGKEDSQLEEIFDHWKGVKSELIELSNDFEELNSKTIAFYNALEKQAKSIKNRENREKLLLYIENDRKEYKTQMNISLTSIKELEKLKDEAIDIIKGIEIAFSLEKSKKIIENITIFNLWLKKEMNILEQFIANSKKILKQKISS